MAAASFSFDLTELINTMPPGLNYINGRFLSDTSPIFFSYNPCTGWVNFKFPLTPREKTHEAISAAREAFKSWSQLSRIERGEYFDRLCQLIKRDHEKISQVISLETGKNLNESRAEVTEALHMCQFTFGKAREPIGDIIASEIALRDSFTIRKPKGVVAVITAWNFPYAVPYWSIAPALLEGNTVVFKPSEETPMVGQLAATLFHEAGFPPGVLNLIHGYGQVGADLVEGDVDHICFTGSAAVGQRVRVECATSWHKTCSCEMGSKSACMIFDDCDLELALSASINSAFKLSGQRCVSSGRMLVQRTLFTEFVDRFTSLAENIKVGSPFANPAPMFGPLINSKQAEKVRHYNSLVRQDQDCQVLVDNHFVELTGPNYMGPFVYSTEWADKPFLKEEVFGPHVALVPFDDLDDAIKIYNDTEYGLALGVITSDFKKAREVRNRCNYGLGYWNSGSIAAESHNVFGGVGKSGNGYPSAAGTFKAVTHEVAWSVNHGDLVFPQGLK